MEPGPTLMMKTHAMGDVLMTTPAIRAFRSRWPEERLDYLTGRWSAPVLEGNPHLSRILQVEDQALHRRSPVALGRLVRTIRRGGYRTALLFQPSWPVHAAVLAAGVRRRIGLSSGSGRLLSRAVPWEPEGEYAGEQFLSLVRTLGVEAPPARPELHLRPAERAEARALLTRLGLTGSSLVLLCPGGGRNPRDQVLIKRWPPERFVHLARGLMDQGLTVGVQGGPGDQEVVREVATGIGSGAKDLSQVQGIRALAALVAEARLLVTNDSAPLHVGIALGTPTVAVFGPTRPESLVPEGAPVAVVASPLDCAPCYANRPFPGCAEPPPGCMDAIPPERVLQAALRLLEETG